MGRFRSIESPLEKSADCRPLTTISSESAARANRNVGMNSGSFAPNRRGAINLDEMRILRLLTHQPLAPLLEYHVGGR